MNLLTEEKKRNISSLFWVFVIIYLTDSLMFATNIQSIYMYVKRFGVIVLAFLLFVKYSYPNKWRLPKDSMYLLGVSISICCSMIFNGLSYGVYAYITMIFTLWFGYSFSKQYSLQDFAKVYCKIMCVIAISSIVCFVFANRIASIGFLPMITNKAGYSYKTIILTNIPLRETLRRRNGGPFWEPGVYQTYLNIALIMTLFVNKEKNRIFYAVVFIITTLSTLSGASLIPMLLIIAAYFFENHNIKSFAAVIALLCLVAVLMNTGMFDEIVMKMSNAEGTTSFGYRISSVYSNIQGFLKNPIFGSSPEELSSIRSEYLSKYVGSTSGGSTNTYLTYLSLYGFFVGLYMFINIYKCFRSFLRTSVCSWILLFAIVLMTSNENLTASLLICTLTFLRFNNAPEKDSHSKYKYGGRSI